MWAKVYRPVGAAGGDVVPEGAEIVVGAGGVAQDGEEGSHAPHDLADGVGVDGDLAAWIGLRLDVADVIALVGRNGIIPAGDGGFDQMAEEHRFRADAGVEGVEGDAGLGSDGGHG